MTKKLMKLTQEQTELMASVRDQYIKNALGGDSSIGEGLEDSVKWLYSLAGITTEVRLVVLDSPQACHRACKKEFPSLKYFWSSCGIGYDSGWTAFYDYFRQIGIVDNENFNKWLEFIKTGVWDMITLKDVAFICRRPSKVMLDEQGRLHNLKGPAVLWADGEKNYLLGGMSVRAEWIENPESIGVLQILAEENVELRRALIQIIGMERFMRESNASEVDSWVDGGGATCSLLTLDIPDDEAITIYRWTCPSTNKQGFLRVPPSMRTCKDAVAWTYGMPSEDYQPTVEA